MKSFVITTIMMSIFMFFNTCLANDAEYERVVNKQIDMAVSFAIIDTYTYCGRISRGECILLTTMKTIEFAEEMGESKEDVSMMYEKVWSEVIPYGVDIAEVCIEENVDLNECLRAYEKHIKGERRGSSL